MFFSQKTLDFLFENRAHDSRTWFHEHHDEYEQAVLGPARDLVDALAPVMCSIDPQLICDGRIGRCISRINRDTRFSKNKELYRDVVWVVFMREKHANYPCFYFELSPRGCNWGCGWYQTDPSTVNCIREMAFDRSPIWEDADNFLRRHPEVLLEGETYKKNRFPEADPAQLHWVNRKNFCIVRDGDGPEVGFGSDLPEWLGREFKKMAPVYHFFITAYLMGMERKG